LSQLRAVRVVLAILAVALLSQSAVVALPAGNGEQDQEAIVKRLQELLAATESKMIIVPFPNSRSRILKADGNADYFLYLERGNLRGNDQMNEFHALLEAGDMAGANDIFTRHSLVSLRISDFGWNGLGVPMLRDDGSGESIEDRLYKNNEGMFGPAQPTQEDIDTYIEYIETILIPALEGGS